MRQTAGIWLAGFVALILTVSSGIVAYQEFMPLVQGGTTIKDKVAVLSRGAVKPGPSFRSKLLVINDCADALISFALLTVSEGERQNVVRNCKETAGAIVAEAPTFSYGWYVVAASAEQDGDLDEMQDAIVKAQNTAPNQEGLAYYRMTLAFPHLAVLGEAARLALMKDLAVSGSAERGLQWIAQRYLNDVTARPFLTDSLELAPPNVQKRFLAAISAAQNEASHEQS